jgi:hypothetical protein
LNQCPTAKLSITKETPIASIGSCFAREIKYWLLDHGFNFIQTATGPCTKSGSARYDRVYNTFTLRQEFERAFGDFQPAETCWKFDDGEKKRILDPYRKNVAWDSEKEMYDELLEHAEQVRKAFTEAEVIIITVGQAEIWFDKRDGSVFPLVPPTQIFDEAIHGFRLSTVKENLANLDRIIELVTPNNPTVKILITVSPVPLRATFRKIDAISANTASKSILRAAVDEFVSRHNDNVVYFPAYEITTVLQECAFKDDHRHVKPETVDAIMGVFRTWFVD